MDSFGTRLRAYREAAGMSLGTLARRIHFSKGYMSRIENDLRPPNPTVAKLCDNALGAGGALIELARAVRASNTGELGPDRRQVLAGAGGAMLGFAFARGGRAVTDWQIVDGLRTSFDQTRRLGERASPAVVLGQVIALAGTLEMLATGSSEPIRSELLLLTSRVAEYTGWMKQEAGEEQAALWWTCRAIEFAEAGGDSQLASYALVREAGIALYRQDAIGTINLARRAQEGQAGPRILGLAARREAQGHALAGDRVSCERALDRAAELLGRIDPYSAEKPVLGSSTVADQTALARGWALCDLGCAKESAELLDQQLARMPATARRARARFGARSALAHAYNGEIDQACVVLGEFLDDAVHVDSATIRLDLGELARTLMRWRTHGAVREIHPELVRALRTAPMTA